ncbi:MAG: SDR family NAD(P)-dependent oxidoreductase [Planctomycetota bacterium]
MSASRPVGTVQFDNTGRVVLVSGGAMGIGRRVCEAFAESGASVICMDINAEAAADLPKGIAFVSGDTSIELDCRNAVNFAVDMFGAIDVLVNNAAIQPQDSYVPVHELSTELWERMISVNVTGFTLLAKHTIVEMLKQRSGVIVNIGSGQAHRTARHVPAYGPAKAANIMQAKQWGVEYARHGIRVVSVSPGAILTPMVEATLKEQGGAAQLANRHPLGRIGRPDEISSAVLWISSSAASFVTATDLEVDGGLGAFGSFADPYPMPF